MTVYGFGHAEILVRRELDMQTKLVQRGVAVPLNNPLILGPVGGGKTAIATRAAVHYDLTYLPINGGENSDPTDVSGMAVPSMIQHFLRDGTPPEKEDAKIHYMNWVLNRYAAMACVNPCLLHFDDLDKAKPIVQGAMLGITTTRQFRDKSLHPGTLVMGAGNRIADDMYANKISESLRTRMTTIEMVPDVTSFTKYGQDSGEIHPAILGYLQFKPDHLHNVVENASRFPTPRSWWEASQHMFEYPIPGFDLFGTGSASASLNWWTILTHKVGEPVANDFIAWFEVISSVNVNEILMTGSSTAHTAQEPGKRRMAEYAAVFAVSQKLNESGVSPGYKGLHHWIESLGAEMKVAFIILLSIRTRTQIASTFPDAADAVLADIITTTKGPALKKKAS